MRISHTGNNSEIKVKYHSVAHKHKIFCQGINKICEKYEMKYKTLISK